MASDEDKIAALRAIRDKTRAAHLEIKQRKSSVDEDEDFSDDANAGEDDNEAEEDDNEAEENAPVAPVAPAGGGNHNLHMWHAVVEEEPLFDIQFNGKNLENGEFNNENLENANFSVANLTGVNFAGSNLKNVDFSGANLTNTNLSKADLSGAVFDGAQLIGTNFTGAIMKNVSLANVDFSNAILLDIVMDEISLEELQELMEYLAKYFPHKLNLTKINLTMLDLKRIDLSKLNLRGVDFTGVDFTGINIMELDLSECIISPEQIAQALGRVPTADEMKKILAPKKPKKKSRSSIDFTDLFLGNPNDYGVYDVSGFKGVGVEKLVTLGKKLLKRQKKEKAPVKDVDVLEKIKEQNRANKEELKQVIELRRQRVLANKKRAAENPITPQERGGFQR